MSKRIFIYARRSSKKNKSWTVSIEKQISSIKNECKINWYIIEWIYEDNQSGFRVWIRPEFNDMINMIKKANIKWIWEKIDYIYVYWASRLCRNTEEARIIQDLVEKWKIKIKSIHGDYSEWLDGQKRLIHDLIDAIYESMEKSEEAKINMDLTYREKWKIARKAAYWYIFSRYKKLEINNENWEADIIKKVFNEYSKWEYTYKELANHLNITWNQKIYIKRNWEIAWKNFSEKDIENIITNEFYYWRVKVKYTDFTEKSLKYFQEVYPYKEIKENIVIDYTKYISQNNTFTPIISERLFKAAEDIRNWKRWKNKFKNFEELYLFQWMIKCSCKQNIENNPNKYLSYTQYPTKKDNWIIYNNYRCSNNERESKETWKTINCDKSKARISEIALEKIIYTDFIKWIQFSDKEKEIFEKVIAYKLQQLWEYKENTSRKLKQRLVNLKKEKEKAFKEYRSETDSLIKEMLLEDLHKIDNDYKKIETEIENLPEGNKEDSNNINDYVFYINKLWSHFKLFPKYKKQKFIRAMFERIVLENKKIVDFKLNPVFELAYNKKKVVTFNHLEDNPKKKCSNSLRGLTKTKRAQSEDCTLYGRPTRNRT